MKFKWVWAAGVFIAAAVAIRILLVPGWMSWHYQNLASHLLEPALEVIQREEPEAIPCTASPLNHSDAYFTLIQARKAARAAVRWNAGATQAYLLLGRIACLLGEPADALQAYQEYLARRPQNPLGHLERGFAYEAQGRPSGEQAAIQEWQRAGASVDHFSDRAQKLIRGGYFDAAGRWQVRAARFAGAAPDQVSPPLSARSVILEAGVSIANWRACPWCQNTAGSLSSRQGALEISLPDSVNAAQRASFGILTNPLAPVKTFRSFAIRLRGSPETILNLEIVLDGNRQRLFKSQPVPPDWTVWTAPLAGQHLEEILIGASKLKGLGQNKNYVLIDWIAVDP